MNACAAQTTLFFSVLVGFIFKFAHSMAFSLSLSLLPFQGALTYTHENDTIRRTIEPHEGFYWRDNEYRNTEISLFADSLTVELRLCAHLLCASIWLSDARPQFSPHIHLFIQSLTKKTRKQLNIERNHVGDDDKQWPAQNMRAGFPFHEYFNSENSTGHVRCECKIFKRHFRPL